MTGRVAGLRGVGREALGREVDREALDREADREAWIPVLVFSRHIILEDPGN